MVTPTKNERKLLDVIAKLGYGEVMLVVSNGSFDLESSEVLECTNLDCESWKPKPVSSYGEVSKSQKHLIQKIRSTKATTSFTITVTGGKPVNMKRQTNYLSYSA